MVPVIYDLCSLFVGAPTSASFSDRNDQRNAASRRPPPFFFSSSVKPFFFFFVVVFSFLFLINEVKREREKAKQ